MSNTFDPLAHVRAAYESAQRAGYRVVRHDSAQRHDAAEPLPYGAATASLRESYRRRRESEVRAGRWSPAAPLELAINSSEYL